MLCVVCCVLCPCCWLYVVSVFCKASVKERHTHRLASSPTGRDALNDRYRGERAGLPIEGHPFPFHVFPAMALSRVSSERRVSQLCRRVSLSSSSPRSSRTGDRRPAHRQREAGNGVAVDRDNAAIRDPLPAYVQASVGISAPLAWTARSPALVVGPGGGGTW